MRPKKIILRTLIALITMVSACTGGLFGWVALETNDSATVADRFLFELRGRDTVDAYQQYTTAFFKARQTQENFTTVATKLGLPLTYKLDPWRDRTLELPHRSDVRGTIIDLGGQDVRFTLRMVKERGEWKVNGFVDGWRERVGPGAWFQQVPDREELIQIVDGTMFGFKDAVESKDFTEFYANTSESFQIGTSMSRLVQAYQQWIDNQIDLTGLEDLTPQFTELPQFTTQTVGFDEEEYEINEVLVVTGYYPLEPKPVPFKFRYVYQHPEWKILNVQVVEPTIALLPPEICIQWLLKQEDKNPDQCFDNELSKRQRGIITFDNLVDPTNPAGSR